MSATIKMLIKGTVLVILLLIAGITALLILLDPNDYRSDIERQAKERAGINLKIDGEISWSLLPIGISIQQLSLLDQNMQTFSSFDNLVLQIDTLSLIKLQPQVTKVLLDGLTLELVKDHQGKANWENLIAAKESATSPAPGGDNAPDSTTATPAATEQLSFLIEEFDLSNARLHYVDQKNNQEVELSNLSLSMQSIALGQAFPVKLGYHASNRAPQAKLSQQLTGQLTIAEDFSLIKFADIKSTIELSGEPLHGKTVEAQLGGDLQINTQSEQITLSNLVLSLANVHSQGQLTVANYGNQPVITGQFQVAEFALPELLEKLGQAAIPISDPKALSQLALSTDFELQDEVLTLPSLNIKVDQANWQGKLKFNLGSQALTAELKGDSFNLDGYLPPAADADTTNNAQSAAATQASGDEPLLPLETLRNLNLGVTIQQAVLIARGVRADDLILRLTAKDGLLTLQQASVKVFEGKIDSHASINAKTDDVQWAFNGQLDNLNILEQLGQKEMLQRQLGGTGRINVNTQFNSTGNTLNRLKQETKMETQFKVTDGAITGVNLNKLACEGFALLNREPVTKTDWPNATAFNALEGQVSVDGSVISSKQLTIENIGLRASGTGTVDLAQNQLSYELELTPVGELGDNACRVSDKVKGIAIPIKCAGALDAPPASLCGLDRDKLAKLALKIGGQELERKAEKEIDRAVEKKLDKYLGEDAGAVGDFLKDKLKGLGK